MLQYAWTQEQYIYGNSITQVRIDHNLGVVLNHNLLSILAILFSSFVREISRKEHAYHLYCSSNKFTVYICISLRFCIALQEMQQEKRYACDFRSYAKCYECYAKKYNE